MILDLVLFAAVGLVLIMLIFGVKTVRPSERGLIERFGKYNRFADAGLQILIPFVERMITVNITEEMVDAKQQEVITKDSLNALVDAQIYFRVREDEVSVKKSQYAVNDYYVQIVSLARTTLRAIMGELSLTEANSQRDKINTRLGEFLNRETKNWGIDIVRAELKEIQPPEEVQNVMNRVVIAEKEKTAAIDFATATETKADGEKRAKIKEAEGSRQNEILNAQGHAQAIELVAKANANAVKMTADAEAERIRLVNESAKKHFTGTAIELKKLETAQVALKDNTKYFVPPGTNLINVIGDTAGVKILPVHTKKK